MPQKKISLSAPKPPRRRLTRAVRGQQLLDAAQRLFIENGYQGTSIEDLARAAGVSRPIIYHHYGSKDGIYLACLRRARVDLDQRLGAAAGDGSDNLQERLRRGIDAYFSFVQHDRASWSLLFGGGVAIAGSAAEEAMTLRFETVNRITDLLAQSLPRVARRKLEAYAHAISGSGEQLAKWWLQQPRMSRRQIVEQHLAFCWHGLRLLQQ